MTFLLDTDHISILQREAGPGFVALSAWTKVDHYVMLTVTTLPMSCVSAPRRIGLGQSPMIPEGQSHAVDLSRYAPRRFAGMGR